MRVVDDPVPRTVAWLDGKVRLVDQRALPATLEFVSCATVGAVVDAIAQMVVRGAPALGATAAYGVALAARAAADAGDDDAMVVAVARVAAADLAAVRPTAVNLVRGAEAVVGATASAEHDPAGAALAAAEEWAAADIRANRALGRHGAELVPDGARVLTHCNAGGLACVGYGTAIGIVRAAAESGKRISVWVDETRPVLQGARLTAWELDRLGIDATIVADVMAGSLLAAGDVDLVVVGADRIAANGDVANKIGTYALAVLAARHAVPFIVAAPLATIDLATPDGRAIPVEERSGDEVLELNGQRIAPAGMHALNRAFDITPAELVTAIVTERGITRPPFPSTLTAL
jgi:methylthioribose-1-phosphate isomerase